MSLFTLLVFLVIICVMVFIVRSIVGVYERTVKSSQPVVGFPVFSIVMLSISLVLLVAGTIVSLTVSDALGGALAGLSSFAGMYESHVRHKREALVAEAEPVDQES